MHLPQRQALPRATQEVRPGVPSSGSTRPALSKNVAEQLPQLLSLVQRVGNTRFQRGEHELQLTRRVHACGGPVRRRRGHVDFLDAKRRALTGKSIHGKALPHLYSFCLKLCWGRQPFLLDETEMFVRLHSPSTRSLGAELWSRLATDVRGVDHFPPSGTPW